MSVYVSKPLSVGVCEYAWILSMHICVYVVCLHVRMFV
jgi:hypothetical protein